MGFADVWNRTLVYFGIAEEDEDWDEDGYLTEEDLERTYSERPNVRRLTPRGRQQDFDDWTDPEPEESAPRTAVMRPRGGNRRPPESMPMRAVPSVQVHLVVPRSFNDAQQIADKYKDGVPVILNLQGRRPGAIEASDRLHERAHVRPRRGHAARGRQGIPADAAKR